MVYIRVHCRLRNLRKDRQLTQEDLAQKLGISRQSIIALEQGRSLPSLPIGLGLAKIFEESVEEIFNFNQTEVEASDQLEVELHNGILTITMSEADAKKVKTLRIKLKK